MQITQDISPPEYTNTGSIGVLVGCESRSDRPFFVATEVREINGAILKI